VGRVVESHESCPHAACSISVAELRGRQGGFNFRPQSDSVLYRVPLEESVRAPAADLLVDNVAIPTDTEITAPRDAAGAFLHTMLREGGKPVRIEVVIEMPAGRGPFPLLVFNHGSTGKGTEPQLFTETWWSRSIADFFVEKGWMVAFPQRRGRGKSDGLYDEGFAADRTQGYSSDPNRSLAGADRALEDLGAAIAALQRRPDVAGGTILLGGQSRGGALSIAYAGMHPEQVVGVLNFVGGWKSDAAGTAGEINGTLFRRGGTFPRPTLWLYGRGDSYYSIEHSRSNFDAFTNAGGKGEFIEFDVPNGLGHRVIDYPNLWVGPVEKYLIAVAAELLR
jgi:dienelactone hydrolase